METKINIAEILKSKPKGTKLYSTAFGQMTYDALDYDDQKIWLLTKNEIYKIYYSDGIYRRGGEVTLYPSKEMRDWSKLAWKKGDVLVSDDGCIEVIFDKWYDDAYMNFYGKHYLDSSDKNDIVYIRTFICTTKKYSLEDTKSFLCYVTNIEERLGGKLNFKTLEIEKQSEKKKVVDLKQKWTPKPFDRVITRVDDNAIWTANIFSHMDSYGEYVTIGCVGGFPCCIPYNEETAKLIGTTNNWKG